MRTQDTPINRPSTPSIGEPASRGGGHVGHERKTPTKPTPGRPTHWTSPAPNVDNRSERLSRRRSGKRGPGVLLATVSALAIGSALTFCRAFDYQISAAMKIMADPPTERESLYRKELLDHACVHLAPGRNQDVRIRRWFVEAQPGGILLLGLITPDRHGAETRLRRVATSFCERVKELEERTRRTPSPAERVLSDHFAEMQDRLNETQTQLDAALAAIPPSDPSDKRTRLLTRWRALRAEFDSVRGQLTQASDEFEQIREKPEPTHGHVDPQDRAAARLANAALQQDLRELTVQLTQLKLHLLNVWQSSAGPLETLIVAVGELGQILKETNADADPVYASLSDTVTSFGQRLNGFTETWNREFTTLHRTQVDPVAGTVIEMHQRARGQLSDFLFSAGGTLAGIRAGIHETGTDPKEDARRHVLRARLVRAFQSMQQAYHAFEFAAGAIETADNFRLDAALRSARGLHRRCRERIDTIERELERQAVRAARSQRTERLTEAERSIRQVRSAVDETIADLLATQDSLNLSVESGEAFVRSVMRAEIAAARLTLTQADLTRTEGQLRTLAAKRVENAPAGIELVGVEVSDSPVNLADRLSLGGLGAGLTLLAVLFGQWWLTRPV